MLRVLTGGMLLSYASFAFLDHQGALSGALPAAVGGVLLVRGVADLKR